MVFVVCLFSTWCDLLKRLEKMNIGSLGFLFRVVFTCTVGLEMICSFYLRKVPRILNLGLELRLVGSTRIRGNCDLAPVAPPWPGRSCPSCHFTPNPPQGR